jgi:hypothetical protein
MAKKKRDFSEAGSSIKESLEKMKEEGSTKMPKPGF